MMKKNINQVEVRVPEDRATLLAAAAEVDEACVSVGGLAGNLGMLEGSQIRSANPTVGARAFARLVEFWRRQKRLTVEELARQASLEEAEILDAEEGNTIPEPRVLYALSEVLGLSYDKLLHLTGLVVDRNEQLESAAIRFAARSESTASLSKQEEEALHEFIEALGQ